MKKIFKLKKFYVISALILVVGYFGYTKYFVKPAIVYTTSKVELGTLKQTVTETGTIKRALDANLNFLAQGRLVKQNIKVGDKVVKGQVLAELDYTNLKIQAKQAQAGLDVARATEAKALRGATSQDVNISQTSVAQAQSALDNAKKSLVKTQNSDDASVAQAQKNLDDLQSGTTATPARSAVNSAIVSLAKNKVSYQKVINNSQSTLIVALHDKTAVAKAAVDAVNRILTDDNAKDTLGIQDTANLTATKNYYTQVAALNSSANSTYATAVASGDINDVKAAYEVIDDYLTRSVTLLNMTFSVLTNTIVSTRFTQAQLDAFKSTISGDISASNAGLSALEQVKQSLDSAQTNYDTVISNSEQSLNSAQASLANAILGATNALTNAKLGRIRDLQAAQSQIDTATQNLKLTQAQLGKTTASARPEDIALASAQVRQAQANLDAVNNQINNSIIKAPFDGQITQVNYQVGEEPSATQPVMVILGQDQYEVQVDVAESDVAKVALGNPVELDFDAFGQGIRFTATLDQLDPAQTVIQEVVYYRGKVGHVTANTTSAPYLKQLKPGMTANVTIMANRKDSVLIIPFRAVTDNNGTRTVDILKNGQPVTVTVTLGLRGDDGLVEVLTGVSAGDEIILSHTP